MIAELERAEGEAYASSLAVAGCPVLRVAGAVCFTAPGAPDIQINRVIGLGIDRDPTDSELDEIEAFFRSHGSPYAVSLAAAGLSDRLLERGYTAGYAWMRFRRDATPAVVPASDLTVETTTDGDAFGGIVATAFGIPAAVSMFDGLAGRPGWTLFLARDGDEPAGAAALYVHDGVGWLGIAGTLPAHRGKGAQNALIAARIERGGELGAHAFTTETGETVGDRPNGSYRNILRGGFEEAYLRPNLLSPE